MNIIVQKWNHFNIHRDFEIFLDMPVTLTGFQSLVNPKKKKTYSRNIIILSVRMQFCQSNPSVQHISTSLLQA